jgi:hypothetical protein
MNTRLRLLAAFSLATAAASVYAERRPEERSEADLVVVGTVSKITAKRDKFGPDGTVTRYAAVVEVKKVEHGKAVRPGQTITVTWSHVTKRPGKPFPAAYGHRHRIKAQDVARFWLMDGGKGQWQIIYNANGVEKVKG